MSKIAKNSFVIMLFLLIMQLFNICNYAYAVEIKPNDAIVKQESHTSKTTPQSKKSYSKRWKKQSYNTKSPKYIAVSKKNVQSDNKMPVKKADQKATNQESQAAQQKQLNLTDFPGKKYNFEDMQNSKPPKGPSILSIFSSLFFVILLIIIFGWFYSKLRNVDPSLLLAGKLSDNSANKFNILSTSTLGQGRNIHLVEIGGKHLVIGSTINNITFLTEINPINIEKKTKESEVQNGEEIEYEAEDSSSAYKDIYKEYLKENINKSDNNEKP